MKKKSNNRILGMTQAQLLILFTMGGILLCVTVLFGWYIFSGLNSSNSVAVILPTSTIQPAEASNTPILLPTLTNTPTNIPASRLVSGGLGLSQSDWEKTHTQTDLGYGIGTGYDGIYDVLILEDVVRTIYRGWSTGNYVTSDIAKAESLSLIPIDSQLIKTYSPEGRPETIVDLYFSESLKNKFGENYQWTGGEPGNFIVQYNHNDEGVFIFIISFGNNP